MSAHRLLDRAIDDGSIADFVRARNLPQDGKELGDITAVVRLAMEEHRHDRSFADLDQAGEGIYRRRLDPEKGCEHATPAAHVLIGRIPDGMSLAQRLQDRPHIVARDGAQGVPVARAAHAVLDHRVALWPVDDVAGCDRRRQGGDDLKAGEVGREQDHAVTLGLRFSQMLDATDFAAAGELVVVAPPGMGDLGEGLAGVGKVALGQLLPPFSIQLGKAELQVAQDDFAPLADQRIEQATQAQPDARRQRKRQARKAPKEAHGKPGRPVARRISACRQGRAFHSGEGLSEQRKATKRKL